VGKYVDWYLVEVERLIGHSIPREKLHETLLEVECHLSAAKEGALASGLEDRNAELAAIESFGTPAAFVKHVLLPTSASWQKAATWLAVVSAFSWTIFLPLVNITRNGVLAWGFLLLLGAFAVCSFQARPLRGVFLLSAIFVAGLAQLALFAAFFVPFRGGHSPTALIERELVTYGNEISFWESALFFLPQAAEVTAYAAIGLLAINWISAGLGMLPRRLNPRSVVS
jgi:hypothetical protein